MENNNLSEKNYPRIAVCGVENVGTKILEILMNKMRGNTEFDLDNIKFICINSTDFLLEPSNADIKILIPFKGLTSGVPFSYFESVKKEISDETKSTFKNFNFAVILCGSGGSGGPTAVDVVKFTLEVGCIPFFISTSPFWFEGEFREKEAKKIWQLLKN